jgi:glycerophosphoryl diester phosphodiesterase
MTFVIAHRGAHLKERENTLDAFRAATLMGVDGVELDVRRTRDGVLVVHHDPHVESRAIALSNKRDLADYVPTLEAAMDVLGEMSVIVEIKNSKDPSEPTYDDTGELAHSVIDALAATGSLENISISSFDLKTCAQAHAYAPSLSVSWLIWNVTLTSALSQAETLGFRGVNPHYRLVTPENLQRANEMGIELNVWTVNEIEDLVALGALGVTSIITDQPERALALRPSFKRNDSVSQ